ncbi:MAG: glycosyl hydrolase [Acidimicrobiia bacterium]
MTLFDDPVANDLLEVMRFRCIGPTRGGRVVAVAGHPNKPGVFYFGAVAGGVWKTEDAGTTWVNVSDGQLRTSSVGAIAVSDSDPNVIFAGMGESCIRLDVSHGDGVYRSGDGGETWTHCGLADTRHIGAVRIHPKNPDLVYVAALGHAFGANEERGLFRTRNGGKDWERILYVSDRAGAVDVTLDPNNPEVLYATIWQTYRNFWELSSGGPDSGIWKSTDGGDTWRDITHNQGLPPESAIIGKVGVAASPVRPGRVWALIEASVKPGLYRSDDFGETWKLVSADVNLRYRPWYYMHVTADSREADTVFVNNLDLWKSTDGGKTFSAIATPHGDNHDLWIDPRDNQRMVQGNDGGANVSFNGGESWSTIYNQATAQMYTVTTDDREPFYYVYGTQQDNSSVAVPSGVNDHAITWSDCYPAGSGESGFMAVHPEDHNLVFVGAVGSSPGGGGSLQRYDHRSGQIRLVNVWPEVHDGIGPADLKVRFPWTYPILFSPHDPGVLYTAGNLVFRSTDQGHSWTPISPDLTRNDAGKLAASGGPITKDTSGAEHYCTIATLRECPIEAGVLWAGSDDGLVHVSRDGGETWDDVTPPDLPEWTYIRTVEPSPHRAGTVYVAATRYKLDDTTPYLYRTEDYGGTWVSIVGEDDTAIPGHDFVRVIRADPSRPGLLYVGTETGLYLSADDGAGWHRWESDLPVTPVYDVTIKGTDLVVATHGRSFWIMDDLTPIHQLIDDPSTGQTRLLRPRSAYRILPDLFAPWIKSEGKDYWVSLGKQATFEATVDETGQVRRKFLDAGEAAPMGAVVTYILGDDIAEGSELALEICDSEGDLVRRIGTKPEGYDDLGDDDKAFNAGPWITTEKGVNRFVWDLRHAGSTRVPGNKMASEANQGPLVVPGTYEVRLLVSAPDGESSTWSESFDVMGDPRVDVSVEDLRLQLDALLAIRDKISAAHEAVLTIRSITRQIEAWSSRSDLDEETRSVAEALTGKLSAIEGELIKPGKHEDMFGGQEPARLNEKLASVISVIASADAPPTEQSLELTAKYSEEIDDQLEVLAGVLESDLTEFNTLMAAADLPAIEVGSGR